MYEIKLGQGCGIKATMLTPTGGVCDLRRARYITASLVLPSGATMNCEDIAFNEVTNGVYVRLLGTRELTTTGQYGIVFNVKLEDKTMYSTPAIYFAEVRSDASTGYHELTISLSLTVVNFPDNVSYTGASPKISDKSTWLVYDDNLNAYVDTGIEVGYANLLSRYDSKFAEIVVPCTEATNAAAAATVAANNAATSANIEAGKATAATAAANTATGKANTAATAANNAATAADTAVGKANAAATAASSAAAAAQEIINERLVLSATLGASGANWPVELTSPLSEVQAAYESFRDAPDRHGWSVVLRDSSSAFIEAVGLEPLAVVGGLELLFTSKKSGKRYAIILTVTDGAATAARVEYRYREDQQKYLDATANFPADLRVKFNTASGCWELSGLTDISDSEMAEIYNVSHPRQNSPYLTNAFMSYHIRTNLPVAAWNGLGGYMTNMSGCLLDGAFTEIKELETVNFGNGIYTGSMYATFLRCSKLRKIIGIMWFSKMTNVGLQRTFELCSALEEVDIRYLMLSLNFEYSPLLSLETGRSMVKNAINKTAITITLHPEAYARWTADAELMAAAREKQIAFATTTVANSLLLDEGGEGIRIETSGENTEMVAPPGWYITQADDISDYDRIYVSRRILLPAESIGNWRTAKASEKAELEARIDEEQPDNRETYA